MPLCLRRTTVIMAGLLMAPMPASGQWLYEGCNEGLSCHSVTVTWETFGSVTFAFLHARHDVFGEAIGTTLLGASPVWYHLDPHPYGVGGYDERLYRGVFYDPASSMADQLEMEWQPEWQPPQQMSVLMYYGEADTNHHLDGYDFRATVPLRFIARVSEPETWVLLVVGLVGLALIARRRDGDALARGA